MREELSNSLKLAMKARDAQRISTIRLINATIKDRDIAVRSEDNVKGVSDEEILSILAKMIKQRQESAKQYEEAGRIELAEQELTEISIIEDFLPKQMTRSEMIETVDKTIHIISKLAKHNTICKVRVIAIIQTTLQKTITIQSIHIIFVIIATSKDIVSPGPTENVSSACSDLAKQYD